MLEKLRKGMAIFSAKNGLGDLTLEIQRPKLSGVDIKKVIEFLGGSAEACEKLGITKGALSQWRQGGIPELRQFQIEALTKGKFKADRAVSERVA